MSIRGMDLPMAAEVELCFSGYNSSVEASEVGWPYWSPVTAWAQFTGEDHINNTLETILWDFDSCAATPEAYGLAGSLPETPEICSSAAMGVSMECGIPKTADALAAAGTGEGEKGLRLFHLLSAAAEAIFGGDLNRRELARVILARLKQLLPPAATTDAAACSERLVTHFSEALGRLLVDDGDAASANCSIYSSAEATVASHLLHDMSPYVNFGHFTANQAILEAIGGERRVHIVDFDTAEGAQWPPLMQAMVSRTDGVPRPSQLKITALVGRGKKTAAAAQETGRRLSEYAASLGLPFAFAQCRVDRDGKFQATAVRVGMGDYLVFNCAIHAPYHEHHSDSSIGSFLAGAQEMGARVVTVVEEEKERGRDDIFGEVGAFKEELERYCAIWDALETGHAKQGRAREMVETLVLGPRIAGTMKSLFRRGENEKVFGWAEWMAARGFERIELSYFNHWQAKLLLGLYDDGYRVEEDGPNKLVLGWKSRRLVAASVWSSPTPSPSP